MKKLITFAALMFALTTCFVFDAAAQKKTPKSATTVAAPKNVVDYLKILPKSYSKIIARNDGGDRLSLIKIDNRKTNFLRLEASNFIGWTEIALFKKRSGGHLVAVNENDLSGDEDTGSFAFYEYSNGKWKGVDPMPRFSYGDLQSAFVGKMKRDPTDEEMNQQIFELHQPSAHEITMKIGGVAVYGFSWNGTGFDSGMLYLAEEN